MVLLEEAGAQLSGANVAVVGRSNIESVLRNSDVVIDVGTTRIDDPSAEKGYRFVGDVDFESAKDVVGAITKVPGGVGPMTITMLLQNTMKAAWRIAERAESTP